MEARIAALDVVCTVSILTNSLQNGKKYQVSSSNEATWVPGFCGERCPCLKISWLHTLAG